MARGGRLSAPFGAAFVLGFALSGFFDGILLHQILQWHHLLSLVDAEAVRSLRAQILADGLFHALMYAVAVVGLVLMWRARGVLAAAGGSRRLWSGVLVGFGAWNVVDVGLFHWILGLHHIRLDVPDPIVWDAGWLVGLGLAPLGLGALVARVRASVGRSGVVSSGVILVLLGGAGLWSLRPPPSGADTLVVFRLGADVLSAAALVDARLVQMDASGSVAVLRLPRGASAWQLYRHGAVLVQGTGPAGCLNWSRPARSA